MREKALLPAVNAAAQGRAVPGSLGPSPQRPAEPRTDTSEPPGRSCPSTQQSLGLTPQSPWGDPAPPGAGERGRAEPEARRARTGRGLLQVLLQQRLLQHELEPGGLRRGAGPAGGGGLPVGRLGAHAGGRAGPAHTAGRAAPTAAQDGRRPRPRGGP